MKRLVPSTVGPVELVVAPAAIERALDVYEKLHTRDPSVVLQARKILTQLLTVFVLTNFGDATCLPFFVAEFARDLETEQFI